MVHIIVLTGMDNMSLDGLATFINSSAVLLSAGSLIE